MFKFIKKSKVPKEESEEVRAVSFMRRAPKRSKKLLGFNKARSVDEAYKHLRTLLINNTKHEYCPVFAVASPKAKGGNSLTVSNLAISFAQLGKKVLLIDANMRTPKIDKLFGLVAERGLADMLYLSGGSVLDLSGAVLDSGMECLDILPAGNIPTNPSELLASESFESTLTKAKTVYDVIFLSLPPVCDYADACVITGNVTGYIFAVCSEKTDARAARKAIEKLTTNGGNIIGTVLTDVRVTNDKI